MGTFKEGLSVGAPPTRLLPPGPWPFPRGALQVPGGVRPA